MRATLSRRLLAGLVSIAQLIAVHAAAQDDATRSSTRAVGYEGVAAYEQGDYAEAIDKLGRAFGAAKVPTLGLWYARALAKTGKLVEASERYGEVTRLDVSEGNIKVQKQAQESAVDENAKLVSRIPALTVTVKGSTNGVQVTIDGVAVPPTVLGVARPVNPGGHLARANLAGRSREQAVVLTEGEKKVIEFDLSDIGSATTTAAVAPMGKGVLVSDGHTTSIDPSSERGSLQRTLGWAAWGLGGLGVVTGVVTGVVLASKKKQLDDSGACQDNWCLPQQYSQRASYDTFRTVSTLVSLSVQ